MIKQAAKEAVTITLVAVGIALAVYAVRADKIGPLPAAVNQGSVPQSPTKSGYSEISLEEAVHLYEEKSALFADARQAVDFEAGHIKGAVHLDTADQEVWLREFLDATDPSAVIVTYCDGENCHLAPALAELLFFNGFDNVRYLKNGWTRWQSGGFPIEP